MTNKHSLWLQLQWNVLPETGHHGLFWAWVQQVKDGTSPYIKMMIKCSHATFLNERSEYLVLFNGMERVTLTSMYCRITWGHVWTEAIIGVWILHDWSVSSPYANRYLSKYMYVYVKKGKIAKIIPPYTILIYLLPFTPSRKRSTNILHKERGLSMAQIGIGDKCWSRICDKSKSKSVWPNVPLQKCCST